MPGKYADASHNDLKMTRCLSYVVVKLQHGSEGQKSEGCTNVVIDYAAFDEKDSSAKADLPRPSHLDSLLSKSKSRTFIRHVCAKRIRRGEDSF